MKRLRGRWRDLFPSNRDHWRSRGWGNCGGWRGGGCFGERQAEHAQRLEIAEPVLSNKRNNPVVKEVRQLIDFADSIGSRVYSALNGDGNRMSPSDLSHSLTPQKPDSKLGHHTPTMMSIEDRLRTVVSLLPATAQPRFASPLAEGESTDTRLIEAVQALAKSEGLICSTREAVARAKARVQIATAPPIEPASSEPTPAERIAACENPQHQTAVWRSLTPTGQFDAVNGR